MSVYILGAAMTPCGKHLAASVKSLTAQAVTDALADAGVERDAIDAAWFANTRQGIMEGQHGIRGQAALRAAGFESLPIFNTDNACASSSSALVQAYAAIAGGLYETALVVGAEKMVFPDRRDAMFEAFMGSCDRELMDGQLQALLDQVPQAPDRADDTGQKSVFMEIYAAQARLHMAMFGTTQAQIAAVASKNHRHSQFNPDAQYRLSMSIGEVLKDRDVVWPLTRAMCAPLSDGASALVLCSDAVVRRLRSKRAVKLRGLGVSSGSERQARDIEQHLTRTAADRCYAMAEVEPGDISLAEVHDATAVAEIIQGEHLRLARYGEYAGRVERGEMSLGGQQPVNVSGGLLSKGHPIAATGGMQLCELVRQLRGEAGDRQVANARLGLAENGGGFYGVEEAACVVTILEAPAFRD